MLHKNISKLTQEDMEQFMPVEEELFKVMTDAGIIVDKVKEDDNDVLIKLA